MQNYFLRIKGVKKNKVAKTLFDGIVPSKNAIFISFNEGYFGLSFLLEKPESLIKMLGRNLSIGGKIIQASWSSNRFLMIKFLVF